MRVMILAATVFSLGLIASVVAANGSRTAALVNGEYSHALSRADKDYEAANRRCEVLKIDERKLCRRDSEIARRAAVAEARERRDASPRFLDLDAAPNKPGSGSAPQSPAADGA